MLKTDLARRGRQEEPTCGPAQPETWVLGQASSIPNFVVLDKLITLGLILNYKMRPTALEGSQVPT